MKARPERIKVKVTTSCGWANKGEIHEVGNYIAFNWSGGEPHFEKNEGSYGIALEHCEILSEIKVKFQLNDKYEAEVIGDNIKVGCAEFPIEKIRELINKIDENKEPLKS